MRDGEKAWFGPKEIGPGPKPVSWEGWLLIAAIAAWLVGGIFVLLSLPQARTQSGFVIWMGGLAVTTWLVRRKTRGDITRWGWSSKR